MNMETEIATASKSTVESVVVFPVQCSCGHLYWEKYQLNPPRQDGCVGFCWCGFCRTRLDVFHKHNAHADGLTASDNTVRREVGTWIKTERKARNEKASNR